MCSPGHWVCADKERGPLVLCDSRWAPPLHGLWGVGGYLQGPDILGAGVHRTSHLGAGDQAGGSDGEAQAAGKETEEALEPR